MHFVLLAHKMHTVRCTTHTHTITHAHKDHIAINSNEAEMHRVLSYQTAMQINEDRDIRAYITKRTCISVIFSASFFTLIMGKFSI